VAAKRREGQFLRFAIRIDNRGQARRVDNLATLTLDLPQDFSLAGPWAAGAITAKHQSTGRSLSLDLVQLLDQRRIQGLALGIEQWLPFSRAGFPIYDVDVVGAVMLDLKADENVRPALQKLPTYHEEADRKRACFRVRVQRAAMKIARSRGR
jgi:hypothetical protein